VSTDAFDRVAALVRGWTWLYTWTVSPELRERRRREIDADLWDAAHDPHADRSALLLLARFSGGLIDDIRWAIEQPRHSSSIAPALMAVSVLALAGWLLASYSLRVADMPVPGIAPAFAASALDRQVAAPPPPPPPPPPCLPVGMAGSPVPCAR
jgi:hypothetical protein